MISIDGAGLIAQVLPVGLLIIAVERRALGAEPFPTGRAAAVRWWLSYVGIGLAVSASIVAVILCIIAVAMSEPLDGGEAVFVGVSGFALALVAIQTTVALSMRSFAGRLPKGEG